MSDPVHWLMFHGWNDEDPWGESCTCEIGHDHWAIEDDAPWWAE